MDTVKVNEITAYVADGALDGDEPCTDEEYEAYCNEYATVLEAEYPGAKVDVVRVDAGERTQAKVDFETTGDDGDDLRAYSEIAQHVQEIGEEVFSTGGWARQS